MHICNIDFISSHQSSNSHVTGTAVRFTCSAVIMCPRQYHKNNRMSFDSAVGYYIIEGAVYIRVWLSRVYWIECGKELSASVLRYCDGTHLDWWRKNYDYGMYRPKFELGISGLQVSSVCADL